MPVVVAIALRKEGEGDLDLAKGLLLGAIALVGLTFSVASVWAVPALSHRAGRWATWLLLLGSSVYLVSFSFVLWPALLAGLFAPGLLVRFPESDSQRRR